MKPIAMLIRHAFYILILMILTSAYNLAVLPPRNAVDVRTLLLARSPLILTIRASGRLEAKESMVFRAPFDAPVLRKTFQEGQHVDKDEPLLELGRGRVQMDYETKRVGLSNAQSDVARAEKDLRTQKTLFGGQAVPHSAVDDAERTLQRAREDLALAGSAFRLESERWKKNILYAPFSGTIVSDNLHDDRDVTAGRELLTLADPSEYHIVARVDEQDISKIKPGQPAQVTLQAFGARSLKAHVIRIGAQAEGTALLQIPVILQLDRTENLPLLPNLTADVRIEVGKSPPTLHAPLTAIDNSDGTALVWEVSTRHRLRRIPVLLGQITPDEAELISGTFEGTLICRQVDPTWTEGSFVRIHD